MEIDFQDIDSFIQSKKDEVSDFTNEASDRGDQLIYTKNISEGEFIFELSYIGPRHKMDVAEGEFMLLFEFTFSDERYMRTAREILKSLWIKYHPDSGAIPYKDEIGQPPYIRVKDGMTKSELKSMY